MKIKTVLLIITIALLAGLESAPASEIIHDAEHYILEAQNGEQWASDDIVINQKLSAFRKSNGGKPPNFIYILLDDVGFGEVGSKELSVVRGYDTPNIDSLAKGGMSLQRMYSEPSCTPTRVAMMTGRYPTRTGTTEAKTTLAGDGLNADEVTIAELLRDVGYFTSHVGKWHLGDIEQSFANNQGFMHSEFPVHQQAQLGIMNDDGVRADVVRGINVSPSLKPLTLDSLFIPMPEDMVMGLEVKDGKLYEVGMNPGEEWTQAKYEEMNVRYQENTLKQLRSLAKQDKPFFLNYWPLLPSTYVPDIEVPRTRNGGVWADSLVRVDDWIGEIVNEVDKLGIAENTVIIVMADNGPFTQYRGLSGLDDRIYRGGKAEHLEGGVRVNAYVKWKGMIEPGSYAEDIFHVSDLFTTMARLGGAMDGIPRDRIIDGVDQSGIFLLGESHGRRDYVHIYEGPVLKSVVKMNYKMHLPAPGDNPITAPLFDLYRDSREARGSDGIKYGPWAGGQFAAMVKRHMAYKKKYPDGQPGRGVPYGGIQNLRPETKKIVEIFQLGQGLLKE